MKTYIIRALLVLTTSLFAALNVYSTDIVAFRIDAMGSRYSDQMWMFTFSNCTTNYDNGYDGFKMFGTNSLAPTIYTEETGGNFQIDCVSNYNGTNIAFKAGEDQQYTLVFTSQYLSEVYSQLYLVDLVSNQRIDIMTSGVSYTFNVNPATDPLIRFKLEAVLLSQVTPTPVPTDTVAPPVIPTDTVDTVAPVVPTDTITTDSTVIAPPIETEYNYSEHKNGNTDNGNHYGEIKNGNNGKAALNVQCSGRTVKVDNSTKEKGKLTIYEATSGKQVESSQINPDGETIYQTKAPTGTYVVEASTSTDKTTITTIVQ